MNEPKPTLNRSLLAFIDILGFSDRLLSIRTQVELNALHEQVCYVLDQFNAINKPSDEPHTFTGEVVRSFSDCIIVAFPVRSDYVNMMGMFDAVMDKLTDIALAQANCVCKGLFLRGGVAVGTWFESPQVILSPALAEAHEIESKKACVPVIGISETVYAGLGKEAGREAYAEWADPYKAVFAPYRTKDKTEGYFLDYLRICFGNLDDWYCGADRQECRNAMTPEEKNRILRMSQQKEQKRFLNGHRNAVTMARDQAAGKPDIRIKYDWLVGYHNRFVTKLGEEYRDCLIETL